jgi:hypothetical protein
LPAEDGNDQFSSRYNYIKIKAPIAGSRITKLKAEVHMSGALASAFAIFLTVSMIKSVAIHGTHYRSHH